MSNFTDKITDSVTESVIATPDPAPTGIPNPIHDEDGASRAGYAGALVAGVRTYGWAAETIVRAIGEDWLASGWVDFALRRPLFAGDVLTIKVSKTASHWSIICTAGSEDRVVLEGTAGLGHADWYAELDPPTPSPAGSPEHPLTSYTLDEVPYRQPLVPLATYVTNAEAVRLVNDDLGVDNKRYRVDGSERHTPIHPYFLAGRMAPLTRHNYVYGPTIHVRSQIQHVRAPTAEQTITIGAQILDAYDRKGHWYQVLDGVITDEHQELAVVRHHTIFRPRSS
ncbi:MAG: hypothetical protein AAF525_08750 [Pseudomonadota bacterium]